MSLSRLSTSGGSRPFTHANSSRGLQCIFTQWLVIIGLETLEDADSLDV